MYDWGWGFPNFGVTRYHSRSAIARGRHDERVSRRTEEEVEKMQVAKKAWLQSGRKGHSPYCNRTHKERKVLWVQEVVVCYAIREITRYKCTGCEGWFEEITY